MGGTDVAPRARSGDVKTYNTSINLYVGLSYYCCVVSNVPAAHKPRGENDSYLVPASYVDRFVSALAN